MAHREVPVILVQPEKRVVVTSVRVDDGARLATVASLVAEKLRTAAGVTALETQLALGLVSLADAQALRRERTHVPERTGEFDELAYVRDVVVEGSECVLVKLVGERPRDMLRFTRGIALRSASPRRWP